MKHSYSYLDIICHCYPCITFQLEIYTQDRKKPMWHLHEHYAYLINYMLLPTHIVIWEELFMSLLFNCQAQLNLRLEFSITLHYPNHPSTQPPNRISSESSAPDCKNILSQSRLHLNCIWSTSNFHLSYIWVASSCI